MQTLGRFAIFIDGSNFYHTVRELNLHVDYGRLLEYFSTRGQLVRAAYYTLLLENGQSPDWLIRLVAWLSYNGYQVVTKQARYARRRVVDDEGNPHWVNEVKGDLDVEIAVAMFTLAPFCDTIILFSGDGSFLQLVAALQRQGCRVIVVSSDKTRDSSVADELRRQADWFLELTTIADEIRRGDHKGNNGESDSEAGGSEQP